MNSLFVCVQLRDVQRDWNLEVYSLKFWELKKYIKHERTKVFLSVFASSWSVRTLYALLIWVFVRKLVGRFPSKCL